MNVFNEYVHWCEMSHLSRLSHVTTRATAQRVSLAFPQAQAASSSSG